MIGPSKKRNSFYLILVTTIYLFGCRATQDSSIGGDNGEDGTEITLHCGVVQGEDVDDTVSTSDGIPVQIEAVTGPNQVIYIEENDIEATPQLLKLQGISGAEEGERQFAVEYLESLTNRRLYLFLADEECEAVVEGGGVARVGTLINGSGESVNEQLVRTGFVAVEGVDSCNVDQISGCLNALKESSPITAGELDELLWKPVSDSNSNLAVHTGPSNTHVIVNGEVGVDQGGGNGFGSLARFSQSGCSYGQARVQVIDGDSGFPYTVNGSTTILIPNGCQRTCLLDGQLAACTK